MDIVKNDSGLSDTPWGEITLILMFYNQLESVGYKVPGLRKYLEKFNPAE